MFSRWSYEPSEPPRPSPANAGSDTVSPSPRELPGHTACSRLLLSAPEGLSFSRKGSCKDPGYLVPQEPAPPSCRKTPPSHEHGTPEVGGTGAGGQAMRAALWARLLGKGEVTSAHGVDLSPEGRICQRTGALSERQDISPTWEQFCVFYWVFWHV